MTHITVSRRTADILLQDATQRGIVTTRRATLLQILQNERYLTRAQLIARLVYRLGRNCFGTAAWEKTFYRDMRVVKQAFQSVGHILEYSRDPKNKGYYVEGQPALSPEFRQMVKASVAEVDQRQIDIYRRLSPADRFRQGCSISDTARNVVAYRIRQENPELTALEANRLALQIIKRDKMALPKITESMIQTGASPESFRRGEEYYREGALSNTTIQGTLLSAECAGTYAPYYQVQVELDEAGIADASCTCLYEYGGYCKHIVALLLAYLRHPKSFAVRKAPAELLADLDHSDLTAILTKLIQEQPDLYGRIEAMTSVPSKSKKKRKKKVDIEVYRRHILGIVHSLDGMRMSEAYWHVGGLANQLREVQGSASKFLDADDAETALEILLVLLEEGSRAIEYVDDSDGELGGFIGDLGTSLAEAILSMELSQVERDRLVRRLEKLIDYAGDYGMEGNLDIAVQAAKFGWDDVPKGMEPVQRTVQKFDEDEEPDDWDEDEEWDEEDEFELREWGLPSVPGFDDLTEAKLNVLDRQDRVEEYLTLCKKEGRHLRYALKLCDLKQVAEAVKYAKKNLSTAEESLQVAQRLRESRLVAEAIEVGEHGLELKGSKVGLGEWLGPVEEAQGRTKQALSAWLAAFGEHPALETYKTIKRLAGPDWGRLRPEVMAKLRKSYDKQVLAEVLLLEEEWDEAIKVADHRDVWYPIVEAVADGVMQYRPEWVAKISLKHAERLMSEAKSKNYPIAAAWLKRAKQAYKLLGKTDEWKKYLGETKEKYKRRPALQNQLARL